MSLKKIQDEAFLALAPYPADAPDVPDVHCSLCDGLGHGQPGWGPCPLEEDPVAGYEAQLDELRVMF